jgi:hypothetical protein
MARRDRDSRIFITLSVDMSDHPKFAPLTKGQKWLIAEAMMYCRKYLTDGCIDLPKWRKMDTKRNREAVEATGVCVVIPKDSQHFDDKLASNFFTRTGETLPSDVVYFPTYFDHQQSRAEVEAYLKSRRSAGKKGGEAKAANASKGGSEGVARATASAVANGYQTPSKSVPESESETDIPTYVGISSSTTDPDGHEYPADLVALAGTEKPKKPKKVEPRRPDVEELCDHLRIRIQENGNRAPKAVTDAWRTQARLLLDSDGGPTLQQALAVVDWCQDDEFWRPNILSMPTFRTKYAQLEAKTRESYRQRVTPAPPAKTSQQAQREAMAGIMAKISGGQNNPGPALAAVPDVIQGELIA